MSKTYKDRLRYQAKHYNDNKIYYLNFYTDEYAFWLYLPQEPKDINEPEYWRVWKFPITGRDSSRAQFWYKWSHRKKRRQLKKFLREERWEDAKYLKPPNVDWSIY